MAERMRDWKSLMFTHGVVSEPLCHWWSLIEGVLPEGVRLLNEEWATRPIKTMHDAWVLARFASDNGATLREFRDIGMSDEDVSRTAKDWQKARGMLIAAVYDFHLNAAQEGRSCLKAGEPLPFNLSQFIWTAERLRDATGWPFITEGEEILIGAALDFSERLHAEEVSHG